MDGAGGAAELGGVGGTDSERLLEDTLVNNPGMLLPGLTLVGRQTRTEGGPLDLLGVDRSGRLALFELKRGRLNRDAVGQVLDYGSWLESLSDDDLAKTISRYSGAGGVDEVGDFADWYRQHYSPEISEARPLRLFLVGLGADDTTARMVNFLADRGVEISLLTFLGFHHQGQTLLARQMPVDALETISAVHPAKDNRSLKQQVIDRVGEYRETWPDGYALFHSVRDLFYQNLNRPSEIGSPMGHDAAPYQLVYRRRANLPDWYAIVTFVPRTENVEIWFHSRVVERCLEQFIELEQVHLSSGFIQEPTLHQHHGGHGYWFGMKSLADLEMHKDKLIAVTQAVRDAYEQAAQETGYGMDENGGC